MPKILAFAGSGRKNSYNHSIVECAALGAIEAGIEVTLIHMHDFDMPLFNEDLEAEQGMPDKAFAFKQLLLEHDAFLIASPEYNSGYSAILKNAIDWASRMADGEKPLQAFTNKPVAIMSASPGALGGIRGLVPLRMLLGNLGMLVLPKQQAISAVHNLLDEQGKVNDEKTQIKLKALGAELAKYLAYANQIA